MKYLAIWKVKKIGSLMVLSFVHHLVMNSEHLMAFHLEKSFHTLKDFRLVTKQVHLKEHEKDLKSEL